jgi:hypothetical protein
MSRTSKRLLTVLAVLAGLAAAGLTLHFAIRGLIALHGG